MPEHRDHGMSNAQHAYDNQSPPEAEPVCDNCGRAEELVDGGKYCEDCDEEMYCDYCAMDGGDKCFGCGVCEQDHKETDDGGDFRQPKR